MFDKKNHKTKLSPKDSLLDAAVKMAEGNIGAATCFTALVGKQVGVIPGAVLVAIMDTNGIYGEKLYMLWNDVCNRNLETMELVLMNIESGHLDINKVHEDLSNYRAQPYTDLKPMGDLVVWAREKLKSMSINSTI